LPDTGAEQAESALGDGKPAPLAGGRLLAAISTSIVAIMREHYGRGPIKAKTHAFDDVVVVIMRGTGFTALEKTIMEAGEPDRVIAMREDFQRLMAARYKQTIEQLTGRNVVAFISRAHVNPDIIVEIFFIDGPLRGLSATEITKANEIGSGNARRGFASPLADPAEGSATPASAHNPSPTATSEWEH
jgi:uncharacterized protein YbcI